MTTSRLLELARAAHIARTTDMPIAESMPALGAFEEACTPDVVVGLCERIQTLEAIATDVHEETVRRHQAQAARIAALEQGLREACEIVEWEASEYQGKPEHLVRLPILRALLTP